MFGKSALASMVIAISAAQATTARAGASTYLSVGDGIAYGVGSGNGSPSAGDQGFVGQFADDLARSNGGTRPAVVNAALPYESLGRFFLGSKYNGANTNYTSAGESQNSLMVQTLAGGSVGNITVSLGTMNVMDLLNSKNFASMSLDQQAVQVERTLNSVKLGYDNVMAEIKALDPTAKIELIGAFNPFHAIPTDARAAIAEPAFLGLDKIIQGEAAASGATYVDTYTAFLGHEGTYSRVLDGTGSVDLTAAGYSALAASIQAASVPEPGTAAVLAIGLAALVGHRARRRLLA